MITAETVQDSYKQCKWIIYKSSCKDTIPMGFEYEIVRNERYRDKPKLPDSFMVQWEGIHYGFPEHVFGYEIKSPVAPLHYHKYLLRRYFKDVKWNTDPNNWGGIHINISRDIRNGMTRRNKVYDFAQANATEMQLLSGRTEESFIKYANLVDRGASDYYNFISTRKSSAFELRMFHAQPHLLLPALEFADSTFELANQRGAITLDGWIKFINRWSRYRNIAAHVRNTLCPRKSPSLSSSPRISEMSMESVMPTTQLSAS